MGLFRRRQDPTAKAREVLYGIFPDAKSVYWSSIGCCPTCDRLDEGMVSWLIFDPESPLLLDYPGGKIEGPHPDCENGTDCTCSWVVVSGSEMPTHEPTNWSPWSAAYIAEHGHPLAAEHPHAGH